LLSTQIGLRENASPLGCRNMGVRERPSPQPCRHKCMGVKPRPPSCRNLENFNNHYPPNTYK
jgi:hypothetical protein